MLQLMSQGLEREVASLKRQLAEANPLRNENEDLLSQVKQLQTLLDQAQLRAERKSTAEASCGQRSCKGTSTKVKLKAGKKKSLVDSHQPSVLNRSIKVMRGVFENFSKDGWEDLSESRYGSH